MQCTMYFVAALNGFQTLLGTYTTFKAIKLHDYLFSLHSMCAFVYMQEKKKKKTNTKTSYCVAKKEQHDKNAYF